MKLILIISLCLLFTVSANAQFKIIDENTQAVTKLTLGIKDSEGNIIENVEIIGAKDFPIYCYITLNLTEPTLVRMKLIAVKAKKLRPNAEIVSLQYKTKNGENQVEFNASPKKLWAEGDYRVDIYLDGRLSESKNFKVNDKTARKSNTN